MTEYSHIFTQMLGTINHSSTSVHIVYFFLRQVVVAEARGRRAGLIEKEIAEAQLKAAQVTVVVSQSHINGIVITSPSGLRLLVLSGSSGRFIRVQSLTQNPAPLPGGSGRGEGAGGQAPPQCRSVGFTVGQGVGVGVHGPPDVEPPHCWCCGASTELQIPICLRVIANSTEPGVLPPRSVRWPTPLWSARRGHST